MESFLKIAVGFIVVYIGIKFIGKFLIGPSKLSKEHHTNKISDNEFESLSELFDDAVNLWACAKTKDAKQASSAARLTATAIAKSVSERQKQVLMDNLSKVAELGSKAGVSQKIVAKYHEIIDEINQRNWELIDVIRDRTELREADEGMIEAVLNFEGNHLKKRFPKHFD